MRLYSVYGLIPFIDGISGRKSHALSVQMSDVTAKGISGKGKIIQPV
jgi:hypothetical protein